MIGIIDYNMGNLGSVQNACRFLELDASLIHSPDDMGKCQALILPGVGAFGDCMKHLEQAGFVAPLQRWIADDNPFLGICVGLQALFEGSEESPDAQGLGILPGRVQRFTPTENDQKVPQMGWNQVRATAQGDGLFSGIPPASYFYFVHSYFAPLGEGIPVAAETDYGIRYASAIARGNLMAVQFHPEKSQQHGLQLLRNFADHIHPPLEAV